MATLNVWGLPEPLAKNVPERLAAIGSHLPAIGADVVAFQEVWTPEAREALARAGRAAGFRSIWHRDAVLGGSGLLVLSKLPVLETRFEAFDLGGFPERFDHGDYYGGKGFVRVRLATPDGALSLVDTHLHARYPSDMPHQYSGHRTGQIVQLAARALEIDEPMVVAGDFNLIESHQEYQVLMGLTGMRDTAVELDRRQPTKFAGNPYRSRNAVDKRKDFVFVRDGRRRRLQAVHVERIFDGVFDIAGEPASYSDHAGVLAEVELAPAPTWPPAVPAPDAGRVASALLAEGRAEARSRQDRRRALGGAGFAAAGVAAVGLRGEGMSRRHLLRTSLQALALLAVPSGLGFSLSSEVFVSGELAAYDRLAAQLSRVEQARFAPSDTTPA